MPLMALAYAKDNPGGTQAILIGLTLEEVEFLKDKSPRYIPANLRGTPLTVCIMAGDPHEEVLRQWEEIGEVQDLTGGSADVD